jgi:hypothetical protein
VAAGEGGAEVSPGGEGAEQAQRAADAVKGLDTGEVQALRSCSTLDAVLALGERGTLPRVARVRVERCDKTLAFSGVVVEFEPPTAGVAHVRALA